MISYSSASWHCQLFFKRYSYSVSMMEGDNYCYSQDAVTIWPYMSYFQLRQSQDLRFVFSYHLSHGRTIMPCDSCWQQLLQHQRSHLTQNESGCHPWSSGSVPLCIACCGIQILSLSRTNIYRQTDVLLVIEITNSTPEACCKVV